MLARAASPLAGEGATFVRGGARRPGIDPRALVAIAAHETMLETYVPSQAIRNAFGLGPGIAFASRATRSGGPPRTLAELLPARGADDPRRRSARSGRRSARPTTRAA